MDQRTWSNRATEPSQQPRLHAQPRVLIEEPSPAAQISDFSLFRQAGFEVAVCSGPDRSSTCPLTRGQRCDLAETTDVVLFGLDLDEEAGQRVLRAHLQHHPETPVVIERPRQRDAKLPDAATTNCTILHDPASVVGQTTALWKALCPTGWGRATR